MTAYLLALLVTSTPCTQAHAVATPCEGVLVPAADLLHCAQVESDLAACMEHRERERRRCEGDRAADREAWLVMEAALVRERDAARERADAITATASGPSWWAVVGGVAVGVGVGVVVGVLVSR